jgi:hypothetical protein
LTRFCCFFAAAAAAAAAIAAFPFGSLVVGFLVVVGFGLLVEYGRALLDVFLLLVHGMFEAHLLAYSSWDPVNSPGLAGSDVVARVNDRYEDMERNDDRVDRVSRLQCSLFDMANNRDGMEIAFMVCSLCSLGLCWLSGTTVLFVRGGDTMAVRNRMQK